MLKEQTIEESKELLDDSDSEDSSLSLDTPKYPKKRVKSYNIK